MLLRIWPTDCVHSRLGPQKPRLEQEKPRRCLPLNELVILMLISEPELLKLKLEIPSLNLLSKLKVHLPRSRVNTLTHD